MKKDLTLLGARIGNFTVIEPCGSTRNGDALWRVKCDKCGVVRDMRGTQLREYVKKDAAPRCTCEKHTAEYNRIRGIWYGMKRRCYDSADKSYMNYGARGIAVCDEWLNDFSAFYEWSVSHGYAPGLSIDRIDVNGGYEPGNCRWATASEQARNKRTPYRVYVDKALYYRLTHPLVTNCDD